MLYVPLTMGCWSWHDYALHTPTQHPLSKTAAACCVLCAAGTVTTAATATATTWRLSQWSRNERANTQGCTPLRNGKILE